MEKNDRGDDNDGSSRNVSDGNDDNSTSSQRIRINNFETYREMKMQENERTRGDGSDDQNIITPKEEQWNHFATPPLNPTSKPSPPLFENATPKYSTPSVFSDLERSQTVDRFGNIFMERMGAIMSSGKLSQAWQSSSGGISMFSWLFTDYSPDKMQTQTINPDDYASERKMIQPHLTPMIWGTSCMMVTLFSLRLGRWYEGTKYTTVAKTLGSSVNRGSQRPTQNNVKSFQDVRHITQNRSHNDGNSPFRKELSKNLMSSLNTLPVDMALSMLIGISTSIFLTRPRYLMKDLSNAPLLEGKSVLAEELCLPFREETKNVNEMFHTYTLRNNNDATTSNEDMPVLRQVAPYSALWKDENCADFDSLRSIRDFVINCQEREKVAKQMNIADIEMSEQELLEVKIPPPGISSSNLE